MRDLIGVKEGAQEALFEAVPARLRAGVCEERDVTDERGVAHGDCFVTAPPLNQTHPPLRVNDLEYGAVEGEHERLWSGITDLRLTCDTSEPIRRGGRARWKIENETCTTRKTQGDERAHHYGHGPQHLAPVFALLTLLAFLVDQAQAAERSAGSGHTGARSRAHFGSRSG